MPSGCSPETFTWSSLFWWGGRWPLPLRSVTLPPQPPSYRRHQGVHSSSNHLQCVHIQKTATPLEESDPEWAAHLYRSIQRSQLVFFPMLAMRTRERWEHRGSARVRQTVQLLESLRQRPLGLYAELFFLFKLQIITEQIITDQIFHFVCVPTVALICFKSKACSSDSSSPNRRRCDFFYISAQSLLLVAFTWSSAPASFLMENTATRMPFEQDWHH